MKSTTRIYSILLGLGICALAALAQTPGTFIATGSMSTPRSGHTATLLQNGKVLFAGGYSGSRYLASAELYDPSTGVFTPTGDMTNARSGHSATLLPDGRVLVTGGSVGRVTVANTELYDPSTGTFTATAGAKTVSGIATLLGNGKVLITGTTPQLYDPATDAFTLTGAYAGPFHYAPYPSPPFFFSDTATLLQDGRVLIVGNADNSGGYLEHEELYDPAAGTFGATGNIHTFGLGSDIWSGHTATLLANGKVLLAGGESEDFGTFSIAELYDPSADTFTATGNMTIARAGHTATLLPDGTVLIAGGDAGDGTGPSHSAELYDPASGTFALTGNLVVGRELHTATLLADGRVLVAGGYTGSIPGENGGASPSTSAELYCPANATCPPDPWQRAITVMKITAGTDSLNFYQWAWYWQGNVPTFSGAPTGFGIAGSISPVLFTRMVAVGGGSPLPNISAEQWVSYFRSSGVLVSDVLNAASHFGGAIAPGEFVVVTGSGLGPTQIVPAAPDSNGIYPAQLAGTTVQVNGTTVPLIYTSATELGAVIPDSLAAATAQITVTYQGQTSASFPVAVAAAAPGIFTVDSTGQGHAASVTQNGSVNTAVHWEGDAVTLFATGLGQAATGVTIHGFHLPTTPISVSETTFPGVMQIKMSILFGQDCDTPVVIQVGNASSQPGVSIAVDLCI